VNTAFFALAIVFAMMCSTLALATLMSFIDVWVGSALTLGSLGGLLASLCCVRVK
jgi:hypothetical protein